MRCFIFSVWPQTGLVFPANLVQAETPNIFQNSVDILQLYAIIICVADNSAATEYADVAELADALDSRF